MSKRHKQPQDGDPAMNAGFDQADGGAESVHGDSSHASAGGDSEVDSLRAQIAEKEKSIA